MASFNVTAEDSSPLISYSPVGAWADSPNGDPNTQSYSQQSWHTSSSQGASATIQFNGTGIWLFGSKRPNYGSYSISIDGQSVDGSAQAGSASFQQLLGGKSGLTNAPHTAVLTNTGDGAPIDLDSIVFETQVGSPGSTVSDSSTDDNGGAITYLPSSADWNLNDLQGCFDNTLHYTQTGGAQAQFSFNGDAVAIYGTVSPDHANYTITVDGQTHPFLGGSNGLASTLHIGTLLYFANGFQPGPHNVTLTANPEQAGQQNTGKFMDIDRVQVFVASPGTANATQGNQGSAVPQANQEKAANHSQQAAASKRVNTGAIVGGVLAGVLALLVLALLALFLLRRRRRRAPTRRLKITVNSPSSPNLPIQAPPMSSISPPTPSAPANPFADPEKGGLAPRRPPSVRNPFGDAAAVRLPAVPEAGVVRDSYDDGRGGGVQVQSGAWSTATVAPARPARPPTLRLPSDLESER